MQMPMKLKVQEDVRTDAKIARETNRIGPSL